ncbi:MAG: hypothetical protein C5B58_08985 [Acidobacteria bacterium]|nr:MAG: hypothetical protein C5B58_08985 [Acidobacteriota bacterium]
MDVPVMSDIKLTRNIQLIPIPREIAEGIGGRLSALLGMVECIRRKLLDGSEVAAADALHGVLWEIKQIAMDLDVHAWEQRDSQARMIEAANDP